MLPSPAGTPVRFYGVAGGAPSLLVCAADASLAADLASALDGIPVFAISGGGDAGGATAFVDADGARRAKIAGTSDALAFLLDANLRVLDVIPCADPGIAAAQVQAALATLPRRDPVEIQQQAPVLLVPAALEPDICDFLINVFETKGNVESGVEELYAGERADRVRPDAKRRRDHVVEDAELSQLLASTLGRRLIPEVERMSTFRATRFEGFKLAAYSDGGFFRAHRDNLSPSTSHRKFSLTLNLNDGYEGGHLRFPEFGPGLYRPPKGGALLFSAALLHEVLPVTRGTRHVLISFLFGDGDRR